MALRKIQNPMPDTIDRFRGAWSFLSNFYDSPLTYQRQDFPTAEHAFQWAKCLKVSDRNAVQDAATPAEAKQIARAATMRGDWDAVRFDVMADVVRAKFDSSEDLAVWLLQTRQALLVEGNDWHDTTWGRCTCSKHQGQGTNALGIILMATRARLTLELG